MQYYYWPLGVLNSYFPAFSLLLWAFLNQISIMILSALLTSVGINFGLCFIFFTLYSLLRKQPGNIPVYAPRLLAKGKLQEDGQYKLERLVPAANWMRKAWEPSDDEFVSAAGIDAFVFIRIFVFSIKVFAFGGVVGILILLPINYAGTQLRDDSDFQNKSLDSFSISNVNNHSNRLWIHFCAAYVFTIVVCVLLYYEYGYILSKRIACFFSSKPEPCQFTVLVRGIPVPPGSTCNDTVEHFFLENHPSTYLSHSVVRRSSKLQVLVTDAEILYKRLTQLKNKDNASKRHRRDGCLGLLGHQVDMVPHYEKTFQDIADNVRMEQSSVMGGKEVPAAFVSFKSRFGAAIALNIQGGVNPTDWITEQAPEPHDVYWPFFSVTFIRRWISKLVAFVACNVLTIMFLIPVALVQGLTHLDQLETMFPSLRDILRLAFVSQVITGYLPMLILQMFLFFVPSIMIMLSSLQGYISWSQIQKSACTKVLWFTTWNIFFANVLSGSALYRLNVFLEPKEFPRVLAEAVPAQASFFIAYVVTSGWTSISSELFQLIRLFYNYMNRIFGVDIDDNFEAPSIPYHKEIPRILFFGLLGVTYFILAPLILPFLLVYFCMGYIIYRNQLLNVYVPKYQAGGEFWPTVHNYTIFSLLLMHIIAIGIFGLKKLPIASGLTLPLPILTLLFNEYCQKRFFPTFKAYPTELLVKKDREDQKDQNMSEFYDKLANAYNDPALMPISYFGRFGSERSPLLHSSEV